MELDGDVWVMCGRAGIDGKGAEVKRVGEIYRERVAGRCDYFLMRQDSLFWSGYSIGRRVGLLADKPVFVADLRSDDTFNCNYTASGRIDVSNSISESGSMEWRTVARGMAIVAPGDTVDNVTLTRHIVKSSASDSIREVYRWYASGSAEPLAIQNGGILYFDNYGSEFDDDDSSVSEFERIRGIIDAAELKREGGIVTLTCAGELSLSIYIMDEAGNIYRSTKGFVSEFSLDISGLAARNYIVSIVAEPGAWYTRKIYLSLQ